MLSHISYCALQMVRDIAAARKLSEKAVRRALDASPLSAKQAVALGIVDGAEYKDALESRLKVRLQMVLFLYNACWSCLGCWLAN